MSEMNPLCYFACKNTDKQTGDNTGNDKDRCIIKKAFVFYDQGSYDQLSDIMGHTTGNADAQKTEARCFFHKGHYSKT